MLRLLQRLRSLRRARVMGRRVRAWWSGVELALARRFGLATREERRFFLLIPVVGIVGGLLGVGIEKLMDAVQALLWGRSGSMLELAQEAPSWRMLLAPAIGGALVGLVIWIGRHAVSGQGMAVLIESIVLRQGVVPPRPVLLSAIAAVFTVGSGGSLGKEGPMIRLGAAVSSWLGQKAGVGAYRLKILVGCGAAAGLASAYNIPIGAALFAMEVILGNFALEIFGPIVVASVIATLISRGLLGNVPVSPASGYSLESPWELIFYVGLGIVGALASVAFVYGVRAGRNLFGRLKLLPAPLQPVVGLLAVGALGLQIPYVLGGGLESINKALEGDLLLPWLLLLPIAKVIAVGLTAGSGGAGGMFTPSLFVGAMVGGAYGSFVHQVWPTTATSYGPYAAVGMAAIAAGTSHAPISSILILFEFTNNYELILPVMVASITSSFLSRIIYPYSVYEESLRRRGVDLPLRMEEAVLAGVEVKSLLRQDAEILAPGDPFATVVERFLASHRQRLFVVGADGRLLGAVWLHDIKHLLQDPSALEAVVAHDLMAPVPSVLYPDSRLHRVAEVFAGSDFERLPVVEREGGRFLGLVSKKDLLAIYSQEVLGRPAMLATFVSQGANKDYVELPPDFSLRLVPVPPVLFGRTLAEARLPQSLGVRVIEVKRQRAGAPAERVMPAADTVLRSGDALILIGPTAAIGRLEKGELAEDETLAATGIE